MNYNNAKFPSSVIFFKTPDILSYLNPNRKQDDLISLQESKREHSKTPSMINKHWSQEDTYQTFKIRYQP